MHNYWNSVNVKHCGASVSEAAACCWRNVAAFSAWVSAADLSLPCQCRLIVLSLLDMLVWWRRQDRAAPEAHVVAVTVCEMNDQLRNTRQLCHTMDVPYRQNSTLSALMWGSLALVQKILVNLTITLMWTEVCAKKHISSLGMTIKTMALNAQISHLHGLCNLNLIAHCMCL